MRDSGPPPSNPHQEGCLLFLVFHHSLFQFWSFDSCLLSGPYRIVYYRQLST